MPLRLVLHEISAVEIHLHAGGSTSCRTWGTLGNPGELTSYRIGSESTQGTQDGAEHFVQGQNIAESSDWGNADIVLGWVHGQMTGACNGVYWLTPLVPETLGGHGTVSSTERTKAIRVKSSVAGLGWPCPSPPIGCSPLSNQPLPRLPCSLARIQTPPGGSDTLSL
jgi:hypothetical protein